MIRSFDEAEKYLYSQLPIYQRQGKKAYKPNLDRTYELLEWSGNPQNEFRSIHIAGTNGKGTTAHALASILQASGYRTGLHTSPHLRSLTERTRVNGLNMEEAYVVAYLNRMLPRLTGINPSFFELLLAMGFSYLAEQKVDIAVVETGLGGRLDSTNVLQPEVSVITQIGWDHMDLLGDTLEQIAGEKAGIIKPNTPVVFGGQPNEVVPVFKERAEAIDAPYHQPKGTASWSEKDHLSGSFRLDTRTYATDVTADYFLLNAPVIVKTTEVLNERGWELTEEHIAHGLATIKSSTGLKGRWQVVSDYPLVVADVSHNRDGLVGLFDQVERLSFREVRVIYGAVKDKDVSDILSILPRSASYHFVRPDVPRGLPADDLWKLAHQESLTGEFHESLSTALATAKRQVAEDGLILVTGSTFLVADLLNLLDG